MQSNSQRTLANRFEGYTSSPSEGVWQAVEASLDEGATRTGAVVWWILSGVAAAVFGALIYSTALTDAPVKMMETNANSTAETVIEPNQNEHTNQPISVQRENDEAQEQAIEEENEVKDQLDVQPIVSDSKTATKQQILLTSSPIVQQVNIDNLAVERFVESKNDDSEEIARLPLLDNQFPGNDIAKINAIEPMTFAKPKRWSVTARLSTFANAKRDLFVSDQTAYSELADNSGGSGIQTTGAPPVGILSLTDPVGVRANERNLRHIEGMISIERMIGNRFSVGVGVNGAFGSRKYTELYQYDISSEWNRKHVYVGIPVDARVIIYQKNRFHWDLGSQFITEWTFDRTESSNSVGMKSMESSFDVSGVQFSIQPYTRFGWSLNFSNEVFFETGYRRGLVDNFESSDGLRGSHIPFTIGFKHTI